MAHAHSLPFFQLQLDVMVLVPTMPMVRSYDRSRERAHWMEEPQIWQRKMMNPHTYGLQLFLYPSNTEIWSCENNVVFKEHKMDRFI